MIKLTERQERILSFLTTDQPVTGEQLAEKLSVTRATLRPDLAVLSMSGLMEGKPRVGYVLNSKNKKKASLFEAQLVKDFKGRPVAVPETSSLYDAVVQLCLERTSCLYVVNSDGGLTGALSKKDLLMASINNTNLESLPVSVVMARMPNLVVTEDQETLLEAAKKLVEHEIDSLPVIAVKSEKPFFAELTGSITKTTIAKAYYELMENYSR
ncbi:CBS domain-containing protein [Evansella sp. LMS18]|uniref:CBS domain-containing protein n=1 Tax=Evansella sp. LMS18 TaxID=2924033 RepID=UPI0020D119F6|nr:CBS domain-containing protein [Evansella sp. LMS18]UTR10616.1 CBS domain-containing protein [Evansella sp. LMS18]